MTSSRKAIMPPLAVAPFNCQIFNIQFQFQSVTVQARTEVASTPTH
jgi:hypothetical protein